MRIEPVSYNVSFITHEVYEDKDSVYTVTQTVTPKTPETDLTTDSSITDKQLDIKG